MQAYLKILIGFLFSLSAMAQSFDRNAFYLTIQNGDSVKINQQTSLLEHSSIKEKTAYEGVLLMKKAGAIANKKQKLETFKSGKHKLEAALQKDSTNTEYHFLRLMMQENAPKILGYHHDTQIDSVYICKNFKMLPSSLQRVIKGYSKQSKILSELK